ncbi:hypothetical protein E4Z66_04255 [Aliishimia ponticola]|uniref:Uncharacterized protein n=1 Tax=Aliishimia ponticola TaxID=2499833 RepID=A0A4S4NKI0_9RHOB|nr:hypothetical protein [Aliishimia ponticola]THH38781.1 hypothetical protein E4Z66_04255 [Aliishimia ponticola]
MNMNQLANMIMRMFIRKAVNKGMNVGINKVGQMRRPKKTAGGNAPRDTSERDRIRAERRARRAAEEQRSD